MLFNSYPFVFAFLPAVLGYNDAATHDEFYSFPLFVPAQAVIDSAVTVDATTVEEHLADEDAALLRATQARPRCVEVLERVVNEAAVLVPAAPPTPG